MQRAFLSFFLMISLLVGGLNVARASSGAPNRAPLKDNIVVRLPNQATLTLVVRDAAQLRELKKYQLDSLTSQLATYITQAQSAAKAGTSDKVTMRFYPDKDQPGKNLPDEIRITARKPGANDSKGATRTQVFLNKKFGIVTHKDEDGKNTFSIGTDGTVKARSAADSVKHTHRKDRGTVYFRFDTGLNAFVNSTTGSNSPGVPGLSYWGWGVGYTTFGLDYVQPLFYSKHTKLALTLGPEVSGNRFQLRGNNQWVQNGSLTSTELAPENKQIQESKLSVTTLNLPIMLRLKLRNKDNKRTLSAGIGAFGGYRIASSTEVQYKLAGSDYKYEDNVSGPLNLNDWQYGLQGELGFHALRFFAKYNLNELFREDQGPKTHTLSFGLRVLGF